MPKYNYTALDLQNNRVSDSIDARDEQDFRAKLRTLSLVPVRFRQVSEAKGTYRLKANEVSEFSRELASMIGSGITVVRALEIMVQRDLEPKLTAVYKRLQRDLHQGSTLSEAMRMQGRAFPELLINMYASGEASGQLEQVASKMAVQYDKEHKLNKKVKSAMTYPIMLLILAVVVVFLLFTLILPSFFGLFEDMPLPLATRIMMAISGFMQENWLYVLIGVLLFIAALQRFIQVPDVRLRFDKMKLRIKVVGKMLRIIYTARFARTLSSLYSSGISMITALEISSTIIGNKYIESQFGELIKKVRNGGTLSEAVGAVDGFDKKLAGSIAIGEETGKMDTMLEATADGFDYESEMATTRLVSLMGPLMIVFMGVLIAVIMVSVILPISLYEHLETVR